MVDIDPDGDDLLFRAVEGVEPPVVEPPPVEPPPVEVAGSGSEG